MTTERLAEGLWKLRRLGRWAPARRMAYALIESVYRHGRTYPIPFGPLRGLRWRYERGQQFWMPLGLYEQETTRWLLSALAEGSTFYDVGANVGYFSLLGALRVGEGGSVVAFEPVPELRQSVETQVRINGFGSRVDVRSEALADRSGTTQFVVEAQGANSHLGEVVIEHASSKPLRRIDVEVRTLDDVVAEGRRPPPDVVKVDVEGGEVLLLQGARRLLREVRPKLLVSTHGECLREQCLALLHDADYRVEPLAGFEHELVGTPR